MKVGRSFATRLTVALSVLLLAYGSGVGLLGIRMAADHERESLQRLSSGLARHIVGNWPEIGADERGLAADRKGRESLLTMLQTVNPLVQVYLLDAQGRVEHYIGEPGMVRTGTVDLAPLQAFLAGAPLPLLGTDPMGSGRGRVFSVALLPPPAGQGASPGYLYVVLDGNARDKVAGEISAHRIWQGVVAGALIGLLLTIGAGVFTFRRLTLPLHRLAGRMRAYSLRDAPGGDGAAQALQRRAGGDEVLAIGAAFEEMTARLELHTAREQAQDRAHRDTIAGVAHDLRTPLTALHGHLEALAGDMIQQPDRRERILAAAMAQSDKVRRLSGQLFELAALQSTEQVLNRERFRLDDLVADTVQKFELTQQAQRVLLDGESPGTLEFDGDLSLVERALTNLIDNALQHAPGSVPVRVRLRRLGAAAEIVVEDAGPGLPVELAQRLDQGQALHAPLSQRADGGLGGLGLAIAQRVALLHGGTLRPLPTAAGGTRLSLVLPLS